MHKKTAVLVAFMLVVATGIGAMAARRASTPFPGAIALSTEDVAHQDSTVTWSWRPGTYVHSTSKIDIIRREGTNVVTLARGIAITAGSTGYSWDTTKVGDGNYSLSAVVEKTTIASSLVSVFVDNTKPAVQILHPSAGDIMIDDQQPVSPFAVVAGTDTISANAIDAGTGVASVTWTLDGQDLNIDELSASYDFGANPGQHTLSFTATDGAGNVSDEVSVDVLALPGPSDLGGPVPVPSDVPDPGSIVPSDLPTPGDLPSGLPTPGSVPSGVPDPGSIIPGGVPSGLPSGVPDPGSIIPGGVPSGLPSGAPDPGSVIPGGVPSGVPAVPGVPSAPALPDPFSLIPGGLPGGVPGGLPVLP